MNTLTNASPQDLAALCCVVMGADRVQIIKTLSKGRCLVASSSLAAGQTVLTCHADSHSLNVIDRETRCSYCLKQTEQQPSRCSRCKVLRYCSRRCQAADWTNGHREECASIRRVAPQIPDMNMLGPTLLSAARLLRRMVKEVKCTEGQMEGHSLYESIQQLVDHEDIMDEMQKQLYGQMASLVLELARSKGGRGWGDQVGEGQELNLLKYSSAEEEDEEDRVLKSLGQTYVVTLLRKMACNGFTITDNDCQSIGIGLFLGAVAANHSCEPSCHALFEGTTLRLRTLRAVAEGEELSIGYIDIARPREVRQKELLTSYGFHCTCRRCQSVEEAFREVPMTGWLCPKRGCGGACIEEGKEEYIYRKWRDSEDGEIGGVETQTSPRACVLCGHRNTKHIVDRMADLAVAEGKVEQGKAKLASRDLKGALQPLQEAYATFHRLLPRAHSRIHEALEALVQICIGLNDWDLVRKYTRAILIPLEFASPAHSPIPAIEHFRLGKLEHYFDAQEAALCHLNMAISTLSVTHGDDNPLVHDLLALSKECYHYQTHRRDENGR